MTRPQAALERLEQASVLLGEVLASDPSDRVARSFSKSVALQQAHVLFNLKGFDAARPFYETAMTVPARSEWEKRTTELSSFIIADQLLRKGKLQEARKYLDIYKKHATTTSPNWDLISSLEAEYAGQRFVGLLEDIERGEGYGWLRIEGINETIRLHRKDFCSAPSLAQFERLKGRPISILLTDGKIGTQKHGRRASFNTTDSRRSSAQRAVIVAEADT